MGAFPVATLSEPTNLRAVAYGNSPLRRLPSLQVPEASSGCSPPRRASDPKGPSPRSRRSLELAAATRRSALRVDRKERPQLPAALMPIPAPGEAGLPIPNVSERRRYPTARPRTLQNAGGIQIPVSESLRTLEASKRQHSSSQGILPTPPSKPGKDIDRVTQLRTSTENRSLGKHRHCNQGQVQGDRDRVLGQASAGQNDALEPDRAS